jgi:hypothetical protein
MKWLNIFCTKQKSHCLSECGKTCKQVDIQRSYNTQPKSLKNAPYQLRHIFTWLLWPSACGVGVYIGFAFAKIFGMRGITTILGGPSKKTMMTCLHQHVGTRGLHRHLRRLHQHRLHQTPFTGGPLQTSSANHNDMPPPTLHRCLWWLAFITKLEGLCQLLQHRGIPHLGPPLRLEGPSTTWV